MRLWLRSAISTLTDNALQLITTMVERAAAWDKHMLAYVNMCSAVTLQFLKNDIFHHFFWNSEKLKSFFLVTPTCRGHSQSDGATGFWGDLPVLTYLHFSHLSYKTVMFTSVSCISVSSHAVALSRDVERLQELKKRVNVLPLGRYALNALVCDFHFGLTDMIKWILLFSVAPSLGLHSTSTESSCREVRPIGFLLPMSSCHLTVVFFFYKIWIQKWAEITTFAVLWICRAGVW